MPGFNTYLLILVDSSEWNDDRHGRPLDYSHETGLGWKTHQERNFLESI